MSKERENRIARSDNFKKINKYVAKINSTEKMSAAAKKKARAECLHRRGKDFTLVRKDPKVPGEPVTWSCKTCGARIVLNKMSEADLQKSIDNVYQACNLIKISLRPNDSERDRTTMEMIIKMMFQLDMYIMPLYKAALSSNGNRREKSDRRMSGGVSWERSGI